MRFEQIVTKTMACLLTAFIWMGCGDAEPSASFQEAQKIHEQLDRLASGLHDELQMTIEEAEAKIQASLNAGDSLLALQLGRIDGQLGALDVRFHDWESTVVALPGAAVTTTTTMTMTTTTTTTTTTDMITTTAPEHHSKACRTKRFWKFNKRCCWS